MVTPKQNDEITLSLDAEASEGLSYFESLHDKAMIHYNDGCFSQSERFLMQSLKGKENVAGPDAATTLLTVEQLGNVYWAQDDFYMAKCMFERSSNGFRKILGKNHLSTLRSVLNAGFVCCTVGLTEKAEEMLRWAHNGRRSLTETERSVLNRLWHWNQELLLHEKVGWDDYLMLKEKLGLYLYS